MDYWHWQGSQIVTMRQHARSDIQTRLRWRAAGKRRYLEKTLRQETHDEEQTSSKDVRAFIRTSRGAMDIWTTSHARTYETDIVLYGDSGTNRTRIACGTILAPRLHLSAMKCEK